MKMYQVLFIVTWPMYIDKFFLAPHVLECSADLFRNPKAKIHYHLSHEQLNQILATQCHHKPQQSLPHQLQQGPLSASNPMMWETMDPPM